MAPSAPAVDSAAPAQARRRLTEAVGVSLGGTFIVSDDPPPVDTDLHLWLHLPQPPSHGPFVLRLRARVRWINDEPSDTPGSLPRGFGVAFRALTAADEIALHRGFSWSAKVI